MTPNLSNFSTDLLIAVLSAMGFHLNVIGLKDLLLRQNQITIALLTITYHPSRPPPPLPPVPLVC